MPLLKNKNILYLLWIFISLLSLIGGIVYFFYSLNNFGVFISISLSILCFYIFYQNYSQVSVYYKFSKINILKISSKWYKFWQNESLSKRIIILIYLFLISSQFVILFLSSTEKTIISPWQQINPIFFLLYTISTIILFFNKNMHSLLFLSLHYFLSFSVCVFIYKIGYGYDPFIHEATLKLIDKNGFVTPKPFYYLGQYSLEIIIHKLTFIPISILNKLLVPVLSAIFLPLFLFQFIEKISKNIKNNYLLTILLLIFPFSFFITTVPQNLAYLFLLSVILFSINVKNKFDLAIIYLLSFTSLIIHPIAGIPAVLFSLILTIYIVFNFKSKIFYLISFIFTVLSLPISFIIFSGESFQNINNLFLIFTDFFKIFKIALPNTENFILNFVYFYNFNFKLILFCIILSGIIIFFKKYNTTNKYKIFNIYLITALAFFTSYLFVKYLVPFNFLINYEQKNYSARILLISIFFFLPFIILALNKIIKQILLQNNLIKIPMLAFLAIIITVSLYNSYPRLDNYYNSHGHSIGKYDIEAVSWIEKNAKTNYIVLANQQVSASALKKFGFNKYYNNMFYYPIPTSGKLYQFYLDMVYKKPSKENMLKAMKLAGVKKGYFVLNKYWWAFDKIKNEAKMEADSFKSFGEKSVFVFEFSVK